MSFLGATSILIRDHPFNYTINSTQECTLDTCSISQGQYTYDPSLAGNVFFASFFGILVILQALLGIYYRTIGFAVGSCLGFIVELIGYVGRVQMHSNPFIQSPFMMALVCVTIAPVFISAAIYLCLSRIIVVYGTSLSRFTPGAIAITFMVSDFISLLLQAGGGAVVVIAEDFSLEHIGIHLMEAGLGLQVASLALFLALCVDFTIKCAANKKHLSSSQSHERIRRSALFQSFLGGLLLATIAILVRSIFRIFELSGGFHGKLWNDEADFMILDGGMIALAGFCLTVLHPGLAFHGYWETADFKLKNKRCCSGV